MVAATQWERLDLPLLEKVAELEGDSGSRVKNCTVLADSLSGAWTEAMVVAAVGRLIDADHLAAVDAESMDGDYWCDIRLAERGRRAAGLWPGNEGAAALLAVLDDRIATADSEDERTRWRQLRDSAASVGQGVLSGVLVETVKRGLTL